MKNTPRLILALAAALIASSAARALEWTDDYAAAVAKARKEHKLVLLDFTGSDWCIWCKRIDADIFEQPKFQDFAAKRLVLVTLDFPRSHELPPALKAQNDRLEAKYAIEGFPTLIVLDPDEKVVFTQVGYLEGGPDALIAKFPKKSG